MHPIIRTLKENLVLHVAGTKSVNGKEKSMFSVSPQAARYTTKWKRKNKFTSNANKKKCNCHLKCISKQIKYKTIWLV